MAISRRVPRNLAITMVVCALVPVGRGEEARYNLQDAIRDTQKVDNVGRGFQLVWWVPPEYWEASLAGSKDLTPEQLEQFVEAVRPYTIVAVVEGSVGAFGATSFTSEEEVRDGTRLVDRKGRRYKPLSDRQVDAQVRVVLATLKPVLSQMIGAMGESMCFMVFPGEDKDGKPIADVKGKGSFTVRYNDKEFRWKLPLGAFMPKLTCTGCKETCSGAWAFCPWCGTSLSDAEGAASRPADDRTKASRPTEE